MIDGKGASGREASSLAKKCLRERLLELFEAHEKHNQIDAPKLLLLLADIVQIVEPLADPAPGIKELGHPPERESGAHSLSACSPVTPGESVDEALRQMARGETDGDGQRNGTAQAERAEADSGSGLERDDSQAGDVGQAEGHAEALGSAEAGGQGAGDDGHGDAGSAASAGSEEGQAQDQQG